MGALKSVNNIDIHYQFADFSVETPGYWKLHAYNDFDNGDLVKVNGVPVRDYRHKQILKLDFSRLGDAFSDSVRMTLTNLLNEVFVTLFAENQPFISAVTPGSYGAPLTYSLAVEEDCANAEKCIFIIEDSQLDIGLLVAVERNASRILQIISDYLAWNDEQIRESIRRQEAPTEETKEAFDAYAEDASQSEKKKGLLGRIVEWFRKTFQKKREKTDSGAEDGLSPRQRRKAKRAAKKEAKAAENVPDEASPAAESAAEAAPTEAPGAEAAAAAGKADSPAGSITESAPASDRTENPGQAQEEREVNDDAGE